MAFVCFERMSYAYLCDTLARWDGRNFCTVLHGEVHRNREDHGILGRYCRRITQYFSSLHRLACANPATGSYRGRHYKLSDGICFFHLLKVTACSFCVRNFLFLLVTARSCSSIRGGDTSPLPHPFTFATTLLQSNFPSPLPSAATRTKTNKATVTFSKLSHSPSCSVGTGVDSPKTPHSHPTSNASGLSTLKTSFLGQILILFMQILYQ